VDAVRAPVLFGFGGIAAVGPAGPVDLGGAKQRAVLALLMLDPGAVVAVDRMVDRIWSDAPPPRPEVSVRGYVSNLRKALAAAGLGSDRIVFRDRGYVLDVDRDVVDLHVFDALLDDARGAAAGSDLVGARTLLTRAIELYGGPPLGSASEELGLADVTAHFEERRGEAVEALTEVRLRLGEHAELPAALASEIARQPYRERLRAQLALALYRAGRPVEALRSISEARRVLLDDVGVDPGPELVRLEAAILVHDEEVLAWVAPVTVADDAREPDATAVDEPEEAHFGRRSEEARIRSALDRLPRRGGVLVVSGEAGIGKSTLLRSLRTEASRRGVVVGWDRCPESAAAAPYRSWRSAVTGVLPDGAIHTGQRLPDEDSAGAVLAVQLGELDRLWARGGPALIVIDDLQWADDATLSLLGLLAPELEHLRILLAVGVRRTGSSELASSVRDCLVELARTTDPVNVVLTGLAADDIAEWAAARAGEAPDPALVAHVADSSGGNPFYVRELLALLDAEGRLHGEFDGRPASVPHAVQDVVRRRVSRLPPPTQAVLTVAAVVGRRFDLDVVAGVMELGVGDALERLEPALADGIVVVDDRAAGRFAFSHALVSSTLVAEPNAARLAAHHARITEVIESLHGDDLAPWVDDLAHHATEGLLAGTAPQALAYALRAAGTAEDARSSAEVGRQLRRAIDAAAMLPGFPMEDRQELLRRLGVALRETGNPDGRTMLVEAARLAEARGDRHALAEILGGLDVESLWAGYDWNLHDASVVAAVERAVVRPDLSDRDRVVLTMALAGELTYLDNARSIDLFAEARAMAQPLDDAVLSARILLQWFWSVSGPSGVAMRAAIGDELVALDQAGALPTRLRPLAHLARVSSALELGDGDLARERVSAARALAHPVRTPTGWAHLQFAEAGLALLDGDLQRARGHAAALRTALLRCRRYTADSGPASILAVVDAESSDIDTALGRLAVLTASPYGAPIRWLEAWILAEGGRLDEAMAALAAFDGPLPNDWLQVPLTTAAVHAAARVDDLRFLRRHLPVLEPVADRFTFLGEGGFTIGPVGLAVAAAHRALGDPGAARRHAEQAVSIAARMGAALWLPRARQLLESLPPP
jgi:DNA-binding SARP family transcriptional activator